MKLSMLYGWLGFCLYHRSKIKDAYAYLSTALKIGQELKDASIIAYASTWLTWVCTEMGFLQKAVNYGENAMEILKSHESDHYLYMTCRGGIGYAYFRLGYGEKAAEVGTGMLNYGRKFSSNRNMTLGHMMMGFGYFTSGDLISAKISFKKAIQNSLDPFYTELVRIFLSACYIIQENFQGAEPELKKVLQFSKNFGAEIIGIPAYAWLGVVLIVKGQMRKGMKMLKEGMRECKENERRSLLAHLEYTAGKVYMQLFAKSTPMSFFIILKNIIFLLQNLPFAFGKAINHFNRAIRIAENIGSKQVLSQTYLDLGLLYKLKGEKDTAQKYILKAASLYEECGAKVYLKQAKEVLESLR